MQYGIKRRKKRVGAKNNRCTLTVLERLNTWFDAAERVSVAASGGVDSTTLAIMSLDGIN